MPRDFEIKTRFSAVDRASRVISKIQSRLVRFTARASMALRKLDRIASRVARGLGGLMRRGAFLAAGAATGLFLAINRTASSMDELAKKTRAMNFPIEEFQEWRFVAEQSGVSSDVFDKSVQKLGKNIGDLKNGTGSLLTILKKNDRQLMRQVKAAGSTSEAFELIVDAIRKTEDPMKKASLATAAFGRAGMDMINMANLGADEIAKLRGEMRENGVVTAEQAAKAEEYNDMMNRLKLTVSAFVVEAIAPLLPMLTEAANSIRSWMIANKDMIRTKITEFIKKIPGYIEKIVYWAPKIAKYIGIFYGIVAAVKVLSATMWLLNKAALASATSMKAVGTNGTGAIKGATGAVGKLQGAMGALAAFAIGWEIGTILHEKIVEPFMKARQAMKDLKSDIDDTAGRDLSKRGAGQIQKDIQNIDKYKGQKKDDWVSYLFESKVGRAEEMKKLDDERKRLQSALPAAHQRANIAKYRTDSPAVSEMGASEFGISTVQTTNTERSEIDININDKSGNAEVKKKKVGRNVNLVHTGAAI